MSSLSGSKTTSTRRPTFASVYGASSRLPAISAPGASSSSTMMLAYGTARGEALVAGVIHDRVGVDRALARDGLELRDRSTCSSRTSRRADAGSGRQLWQRCSFSTPCFAASQKGFVHSFGTGIGRVTLVQSLIVGLIAIFERFRKVAEGMRS